MYFGSIGPGHAGSPFPLCSGSNAVGKNKIAALQDHRTDSDATCPCRGSIELRDAQRRCQLATRSSK